MAVNLKYLEAIELPCKVIGSYSCEISESGYISIATTSALYIYRIEPLKHNASPALSIKKYKMLPSPFILSSNVGIDINLFLHDLPQNSFYEGILSTELSGKLTNGNSVGQRIVKSAWSPKIIDDCECCIAVLCNTGSLEIAMKRNNAVFYEEFQPFFNISQKYTELCREAWQDKPNLSPLEEYDELKRRVYETLPTAFVWSDIILTYCILVVAHACGDISFWKVNKISTKDTKQPEVVMFMNVVNANIVNISTLRWKTIQNNAMLFMGNLKGEVNCLKLGMLDKEQVIISGELHIWHEVDELSVKDIIFLSYWNKHYVIIVKGSQLIILLLAGKNLEKLDSYVFHVGNIGITAVEVIAENKLLITSLTGAIKELVIGSKNSKINIQWKHFYVNINWYIYECLNLSSSINKALFFFLTGPCKTADTKDDRDLNNLVIFLNSANDPLQTLLDNPTNSLEGYWDCLEACRCQTIIDKQLSPLASNFEKDYSGTSLYKFNLLLWISRLSETIYEQTGYASVITKSYEDCCQIFNIKAAIHRLLYLVKLYEEKRALTEFQLQNIILLRSYLKQVVAENWILKLDLGNNTVNLLLNLIPRANEVDYQSLPDCYHCGEKLMGISCQPSHFDMRCSISFMQIIKYPDYKCLLCGSIAHSELEKEVDIITCLYCNISMSKRE